MRPLDETQPCPMFSKVAPGVYIHAGEAVCEWCLGDTPECPQCGGMGPYRPLLNVRQFNPLHWAPQIGPWDATRYRK